MELVDESGVDRLGGEVGTADGAPYIAMEWIEGKTLRHAKPSDPRATLRAIAEVLGPEALEGLIETAYADAKRTDGPSRTWFLSQLRQVDSGARLPPGLPKLGSFEGCVEATSVLGEMARLGKITLAEAEKEAEPAVEPAATYYPGPLL